MQSKLQESREVIAQQKKINELKAQIRLLKTVKNFRDLVIGSGQWNSYLDGTTPEEREEMLEWARGGVLTLAELSRMEEVYFGSKAWVKEYFMKEEEWTWDMFIGAVEAARLCNASFIYAPMIKQSDTWGLNAVLSKCKDMNMRFIPMLTNDAGHAIGVDR